MAELLIKADNHWMDSLTLSQVNAMDSKQKASYNCRYQKGDVICVRPDGWQWGTSEQPPQYIVVKMPGVAVEDVKHYEEPLISSDPLNSVTLKRRKHAFSSTEVDKVVNKGDKHTTLTKTNFDKVLNIKKV